MKKSFFLKNFTQHMAFFLNKKEKRMKVSICKILEPKSIDYNYMHFIMLKYYIAKAMIIFSQKTLIGHVSKDTS